MSPVCWPNTRIKVLCVTSPTAHRQLSMNLIIREKNQHSNCKRPGADPASVILQTSKGGRKMSRDLRGRCSEQKAILADHFKRARSDEEESQSSVNTSGLKYNSCPCLLCCHQTGTWPQVDVRPPGCGHEVMGSDPKALAAEKWDMTIFSNVFFFAFLSCMHAVESQWKALGRNCWTERRWLR